MGLSIQEEGIRGYSDILHGFPKDKVSYILVKGTNKGYALILRVPIREKMRSFLIDTGSSLSYIYFKPMGFEFDSDGTVQEVVFSDGSVIVYRRAVFGSEVFWYSDIIPEPIKAFNKVYKLQLDGVLGMDYLLHNKINLDFSKMM